MVAAIEFRLTGGGANADPDASLGGTMSSVELSGTALNNLFDDVDESEASAGDIEYRAFDIYNAGDEQADDVTLWIDAETSSGDTEIDVAIDATATQLLTNESTTPDDPALSFTHPISEGGALDCGDIAAAAAVRIFVRRTVDSSAVNTRLDLCGITVRFA
jgi:hypothetical protein